MYHPVPSRPRSDVRSASPAGRIRAPASSGVILRFPRHRRAPLAPPRYPLPPGVRERAGRWAVARMLLRVVGAIVVGAACLAGSVRVTGLLLHNIHWRALASAAPPVPMATAAPLSLPPGSVAIGLGATQSLEGVTLTVSRKVVSATQAFLAAPPGQTFLVLTAQISNTNPSQTVVYSAYDFLLADDHQTFRHQDFAALAHPLGTGILSPHSTATGDLAFLIPANSDPQVPGLHIVYYPPGAGDQILVWVVSLQ